MPQGTGRNLKVGCERSKGEREGVGVGRAVGSACTKALW